MKYQLKFQFKIIQNLQLKFLALLKNILGTNWEIMYSKVFGAQSKQCYIRTISII